MTIDELLSTQLGLLVMAYGKSGSGKTKAWGHLDPKQGVVVLSEVNGVRTIKRMFPDYQQFHIEVPRSVHEFRVLVGRLVASKLQWVVVDTVTSYYRMVWNEYLEDRNLEPHDVSFSNYQHCLHYFESFMYKMVDLANTGTNVFLTCHVKYKEEGDDKNKTVWTEPDLPGQLPELVSRRLDVLCQSECIKAGMDWKYRFNLPHGRSSGKDILGVEWPIINDFSTFLPYVRKEGPGGEPHGVAPSPTVAVTSPPAPPPSLPKPSNRAIPKAHKELLRSQAKTVNINEEALNAYCKKNFGKESIDDVTRRQFDTLQAYIETQIEAKETLK